MKDRYILTKDNVYELVKNNQYLPKLKNIWISRCYTGRYNNSNTLSSLAFPGGDVGELALLYSAGNSYGFSVNYDKAFQVICNLIGGIQHFSFHSDNASGSTKIGSGCVYINSIYTDPESYTLQQEDLQTIENQILAAKKGGAEEIILSHEVHEGAVIIFKGEKGILPQYIFEVENQTIKSQVILYHQTLVNERRKQLVKKYMEENAVTLYEGCDEEYLYQVLSDVAEIHLFQTLQKTAKGIPIYKVELMQDKINIDLLDNVI